MLRPALVPLLLTLALGACASSRRDRTTLLPTERPVEEARRMYADASRAFSEKRYDDAADLFEEVYETWPASTLSTDAEYWAAESLYWDDELRASYLAFQDFLSFHGTTAAHADRIERRLFLLGVRQIREGRSGLLGLGMFKTSDQGVETLRFVAAEFPKGAHADDALMEVGRYLRSSSGLEEAVTTYRELLDRHPRSPWRYQARLLLASSLRELNRGAPYDPGTLRRAREEYGSYVREASADPARETELAPRIDLAERRIREIDETLGANELLAARWYIHLEADDAAAFYLTRAASLYADTEAGREAVELLRSMGRPVPEPGAAPVPPEKEPVAPAAGS